MPSPENKPKKWAGDGASATDRPSVKFIGVRTEVGTVVAREDDSGRVHSLPLRRDVRNHSPAGFEWGYGGSGPAQLALAILSDVLGAATALEVYQRFKFEVVSNLPAARWELTREEILAWHRAVTQQKADPSADAQDDSPA